MSKKFTDKAGREWTVHIGLVALGRMRLAGVPLEDLVPLPGAKGADTSLVELSDLLHGSYLGARAVVAILAPAIEKAGISQDDWLESVDDRKVMLEMSQALYEAIIDFFQPSPLRQTVVKQAWRRGAAMMATAAEKMDKHMDRYLDVLNQTPEEEMTLPPIPGKNSAGSTQESLVANHRAM